MDKAKTLEVLRGMKFMQRKEEAKRRAAFEVAQRDEIERQLLHPGTGSSGASGGVSDGGSSALRDRGGGGPVRATVLYDDSFPTHAYSLSRRSFTETLGGGGAIPVAAGLGDTDAHLEGSAVESRVSLKDVGEAQASADAALDDSDVASDEEVADLWGGEDAEGELNDPTAASDRRNQGVKRTRDRRGDRNQHACSDGRFIVKPSLRAPKLPRRLQETVAEQKRQRAEEEGDMNM
ncbi:conserved hypothetical protein [Leishmania major strain Friedlin]|uniref:Uncharacterized protein n=1 Tax=Leishmania major TaxID=5664 RepID=Q4QAT1_LEIMA|nr:conserved hypothetical protein [Leishmania major strain Friedlin]CAG9574516.1 hypothetical_protein_-_conserved [Leishmania major strain Friedlin]CAJ04274.1 conserved hypothetical protein [Leishmania major strain Friedlin]|eukprot:XP_001683567.1 conserved hypothetical protein [Leishmania major strain Friedlin]